MFSVVQRLAYRLTLEENVVVVRILTQHAHVMYKPAVASDVVVEVVVEVTAVTANNDGTNSL